jgi:hypothetical protein
MAGTRLPVALAFAAVLAGCSAPDDYVVTVNFRNDTSRTVAIGPCSNTHCRTGQRDSIRTIAPGGTVPEGAAGDRKTVNAFLVSDARDPRLGCFFLVLDKKRAHSFTEPVSKAGRCPQRKQRHRRTQRAASARCQSGVTGCRAVRGLVVHVQAVDPDGDGDAHIALLDPRSLTYPGIAVIRVTRDVRPRRLPRTGDEVAAAGPVQRSSDGSSEIRASELDIARR